MSDLTLIERIEALFRQHGARVYEDRRDDAVSALAHALQCAQLAEWAHAPPALVAAALLHDIGHFLNEPDCDTLDDVHEELAVGLLSKGFGAAVWEPIRLHVEAKRFLVAVDAGYAAKLSPASVHSLALQGGAFTADEVRRFEALPFASDAVALRRWDDLAKTPHKTTPPLDYYLTVLEALHDAPAQAGRVSIGALNMA